jgi:hypothetical protein
MTIAETFQCKIIDEYGGEYPEAIVAILDGHEYLNRSFNADAPGSEFVFKTRTDGVSYMVMYCYKRENVGKFKWRPLRIADGDGFTNVIKVDMEHPEAVELLERPNIRGINQDDSTLHLIKSDLIRMFK